MMVQGTERKGASWREVRGRERDGMMLEISGYRHRQRGAGGFNAKSPGNQKKGKELIQIGRAHV